MLVVKKSFPSVPKALRLKKFTNFMQRKSQFGRIKVFAEVR
jgi:hypothetical protein